MREIRFEPGIACLTCFDNNGIQSKLCVTMRTKEKNHHQASPAVPWKRHNIVNKNTVFDYNIGQINSVLLPMVICFILHVTVQFILYKLL